MMQLQPSRSRVLLVAVPAAVLAAVLIATAFRPGPVASLPSPSPAGSVAASLVGLATVAPSARHTPRPTRFPPYVPPPAPCIVPQTLPGVGPSAAAPVVVANGVSMLFSSHLYGRRSDGTLAVLDNPNGTWEMGLWFVPAGSEEPRLLAAPEGGMVLPLALSPDGNVAAVWWLSSRRMLAEEACDAGIYLISTVTGQSQLVIRADWTAEEGVDDNDTIGSRWRDRTMRGPGSDAPRDYELPEARLSSDGRYLALIDDESIAIYLDGEQQPLYRHEGACSGWMWSPVGAVFVAGCESMTSAWLVDAGEGYSPLSIALPWFASEGVRSGWFHQSGEAIGLTRDGQIRLAAFYGFATGCEDPNQPCNIPPPAYAMITVDPESKDATIRSGQVSFLADEGVAFAADASWVYVERSPKNARTVRAATGDVAKASRLETVVGAAADGTLLFGRSYDAETGLVAVSSLNAFGTTRQVATIGWAVGAIDADAADVAFLATGLIVGAPGG